MLEITLTLGSRTRRVSAHELLAALHGEPSIEALAKLVLGADVHTVIHGEEGGKGVERGLLGVNANANENSSEAFRSVGKGLGEPTPVDNVDERAAFLADALRDRRSLAWYRQVARRVPRDVVRDALTRALDVPRRDLRRSRAALFTSIVRPHLAPYAHPPSTPS